MMSKKIIFLSFASFLLLCVLLYIGFTRTTKNPISTNVVPQKQYGNLAALRKNSAFITANDAYLKGDIVPAISTLKSLRSTYATGTPERASLDITIVSYLYQKGDTGEALKEAEAIVKDATSYNIATRSFAVNYIVRISQINSTYKTAILDFIKTTVPTSYVKDSSERTLISFQEYGQSLYEVAIGDAFLAFLYSQQLSNTAFSSTTRATYEAQIPVLINKAATNKDYIVDTIRASMYYRSALALINLENYKEVKDKTFTEKTTIVDLLDQATSLSKDKSIFLNYAGYLNQSKFAKDASAQKMVPVLITNFLNSKEGEHNLIIGVKQAYTTKTGLQYDYIVSLSKRDPAFKKYIDSIK